MATRQCGLCGATRPVGAFDRQRKDCRECRAIEAQRPPRGQAPVERALTPPGAKSAIRAACRHRSRETGLAHAVDHVIPVRGKVRRRSDDWVLICGLDIPDNWQIIPARENGAKWMHFSDTDARAEEKRLMALHRPGLKPR